MAKILITGGSGFIGTNLIEYLHNSLDCSILNLDIASPKIEAHHKYWKCVDIRDIDPLRSEICAFMPEIIIHLAARTDLNGKSIDEYDSNTVGVENLIEVLNSQKQLVRVLFASSMYVCKPGYKPLNMDDFLPHTVYGESKVLTEKIIKSANLSFPWVIFRPTSIWGPWFSEPYIDFFNIVLSRRFFHPGNRACKKTYGYIDNTVHQIVALINAPQAMVYRKVFYLGDWPAYDISEWADEIAAKASIKIPRIPYFVFKVAGYFGDILKLFKVRFPMTSFRLSNMTTDNVHNLEAIKEVSPDLPVSREEGVKRTIKWMNVKKSR